MVLTVVRMAFCTLGGAVFINFPMVSVDDSRDTMRVKGFMGSASPDSALSAEAKNSLARGPWPSDRATSSAKDPSLKGTSNTRKFCPSPDSPGKPPARFDFFLLSSSSPSPSGNTELRRCVSRSERAGPTHRSQQ